MEKKMEYVVSVLIDESWWKFKELRIYRFLKFLQVKR